MSNRMLVELEKESKRLYLVSDQTGSRRFVGDLCCMEDGFYQFFPDLESRGGYWPSWILRKIADKVDELNAPWEEQIAKDIGHE